MGHLSENSNTAEAAAAAMRAALPMERLETFLCACAGEATPLIEVGPEVRQAAA